CRTAHCASVRSNRLVTATVATRGLRADGHSWSINHLPETSLFVDQRRAVASPPAQITDFDTGPSAGQVLAPWPNRIRDGQYTFGGETHQLPLTEPDRHNALHGLVNWLPWRRVDFSESSVTCECLLPAQPGYPWTLSLRTTWELSDAGLSAAHWVTNLAGAPAPFGFSVHPYLQLPGVPVADLRLRVPAKSRLLTDSRLLPIGAAKIEGTEWDFTSPRRIGDLVMDTAFGSVVPESDGGSAVTVTAPDGTGLRLWADASFRW